MVPGYFFGYITADIVPLIPYYMVSYLIYRSTWSLNMSQCFNNFFSSLPNIEDKKRLWVKFTPTFCILEWSQFFSLVMHWIFGVGIWWWFLIFPQIQWQIPLSRRPNPILKRLFFIKFYSQAIFERSKKGRHKKIFSIP